MPGFSDGMSRAFTESVSGIVSYVILVGVLEGFGVPFATILVNIISIMLLVFLFDKMIYWSITYTLGWIVGFCLIGNQIVGLLDFIIYIGLGGIALYIKLNNKF